MDFPGTRALDNVSVEFRFDEIRGLIGENGAGKSTLVNVLGGTLVPSAGKISVNGAEVVLHSPHDALQNGIAHVSQEGSLVSSLTGAENIMLGAEPRTLLGVVRKSLLKQNAEELLKKWFPEVAIDLNRPVAELPMAEQKVIEIVRALRGQIVLIILDEPTATLEAPEKRQLWNIMRELPKRGIGVVLISHFLSEIVELSDRITVLRDGRLVGNMKDSETSEAELTDLMLRRENKGGIAGTTFERTNVEPDSQPVLAVRNWQTQNSIVENFEIRPGEIVGFIGLTGAGHFDFARSIYDLSLKKRGSITLADKEQDNLSISKIRDAGIAFIPDQRMINSLAATATVNESLTIIHPNAVAKAGVFNRKAENKETDRVIEFLKIKTPNRSEIIKNLSGGNKQKVSIGKWLYGVRENYKVMIFIEPTEGVDIGAKGEIYTQLNALAQQGVAIIIASSDLVEIELLCNRAVAFVHGRVSAQLTSNEFSEENFIRAISGEIN